MHNLSQVSLFLHHGRVKESLEHLSINPFERVAVVKMGKINARACGQT